MSGQERNPESVFHEALQISNRTARQAFLERACEGDAALRERVETLLSAQAELGSFLSLDAAETIASPAGSKGSQVAHGSMPCDTFEQPGTVIGRYKLLQRIGEGGFGTVYLAEQREPVQRKVAFKIIKLGMDTRDVIARFEQERQALALMDHPNIAKVLDAGATATGRPYFVMEFVKGVPITDYCDKNNLPFQDRLDLFVQVCGAVQHAHQKGIIHRDIKPSNILVATTDGNAVPKVIDFGIAKATQQKLTSETMFTQIGQFMGTPAYMSPEQADPVGHDVDTRTDIYSLGVLLYELLTGATPFEMNTLRSAAIEEVKRIIRENDPPRPSTRLSTLGEELTAVAKMRGLEPRKFGTVLRGDLDWIIMKALEKDRTRRYETATDFARDIERYLNHEPVQAGPPSMNYRLRKFVRRNRASVAAALIGLAALVGFAGTMAVQARRIALERDRAKYERQLSDRVVDFQANMLRSIRPVKLGEGIATDLRSRLETTMTANGDSVEQRQASQAALDSSLSRINLTDTARTILDENILTPASKTINDEFASQPEVMARLEHVLARTYMGIGMSEKGILHAQQALELRRKTLGEEHRDTLRSLNLYAMHLFDLDRSAECGDILRRTITSFEKVFGPEDPDTLHAKVCLTALGVGRNQGDLPQKKYRELIDTLERVLGPDSPDLASLLSNYGVILLNQHLYDDAISVLERSIAINSKTDGPDETDTLFAMETLAKALQGAGRKEEATRLQNEAFERTIRVRGARHPESIQALANLADLYKDQGNYQAAEPLAKRSLELHREVFGSAHRRTVKNITDVGIILGMLGRHAEAEAYHIEAYERTNAEFGPQHQDTLDDLNNLAVHYWYLGQYPKALELFEEVLARTEKRLGKDNVGSTSAMCNLAILYTRLGRYDESQPLLEKALAIRLKVYGADHGQTLQVRASLTHLYYEKGDLDKAESMYRDLIASQKKTFGPEHSYTLESMYNYGVLLNKLGKSDEAAAQLEVTLEARRRVVGKAHSETLDTVTELAGLRLNAGNTEEARSLYMEAIALRRERATANGASPAELHACARLLLVCPIDDLRNPTEALEFAERAADSTNYGDPKLVATLARALFDTGNKEKAIEMQQKALALVPSASPERRDLEETLTKYEGSNAS